MELQRDGEGEGFADKQKKQSELDLISESGGSADFFGDRLDFDSKEENSELVEGSSFSQDIVAFDATNFLYEESDQKQEIESTKLANMKEEPIVLNKDIEEETANDLDILENLEMDTYLSRTQSELDSPDDGSQKLIDSSVTEWVPPEASETESVPDLGIEKDSVTPSKDWRERANFNDIDAHAFDPSENQPGNSFFGVNSLKEENNSSDSTSEASKSSEIMQQPMTDDIVSQTKKIPEADDHRLDVRQLEALTEKISSLAGRNRTLEQDIVISQKQVEEYSRESISLRSKLEAQELLNCELAQQIKVLESSHPTREIIEQVISSDCEAAIPMADLKKISKEMKEQEKLISGYQRENEILLSKLRKANKEIEALRHKVSKASIRTSMNDRALMVDNSSQAEHLRESLEAESQIQYLKQEIDRWKAENSEKGKEILDLRSQLANFQVKGGVDASVMGFSNTLAELPATKEFQAPLDQSQNTIGYLRREIHDLKKEKETTRKARASYQRRLRNLEKTNRDLRRALQQNYPDSIVSLIAASSIPEDESEAVKKASEQIKLLQEEVKLREEMYKRRLKGLRRELERFKQANARNLESVRKEAKSGEHDSAHQLDDSARLKKDMVRLREFYKKKIERYKRKLDTKETQNPKLDESQFRAEVDELRETKTMLQARVHELEGIVKKNFGSDASQAQTDAGQEIPTDSKRPGNRDLVEIESFNARNTLSPSRHSLEEQISEIRKQHESEIKDYELALNRSEAAVQRLANHNGRLEAQLSTTRNQLSTSESNLLTREEELRKNQDALNAYAVQDLDSLRAEYEATISAKCEEIAKFRIELDSLIEVIKMLGGEQCC